MYDPDSESSKMVGANNKARETRKMRVIVMPVMVSVIAMEDIRKLGKFRFSNMTFTDLSQYYNTQITVYNLISVTCRIMVTS